MDPDKSQTLLAKLIGSPEFLRDVTGMIPEEIIGRPCVAITPEGTTDGTVVDYELTGSLQLSEPTAEESRFNIIFESAGIASGTCPTAGGEERTFSRDGRVRGVIRVEIGEAASGRERAREILDHTGIDISISEVDVDENPQDSAAPEKFAGES